MSKPDEMKLSDFEESVDSQIPDNYKSDELPGSKVSDELNLPDMYKSDESRKKKFE